ncbi:MAG: hypothetical protein ACD_58C00072G0007, partial [uncultured bacterium]
RNNIKVLDLDQIVDQYINYIDLVCQNKKIYNNKSNGIYWKYHALLIMAGYRKFINLLNSQKINKNAIY